MTVVVDVIDSKFPLRRLEIAMRAERYLMSTLDAAVERGVRVFETPMIWTSSEAPFDPIDIHVVFLHAGGEPDWETVAQTLIDRYGISATDAVRLFTYTGGTAAPEHHSADAARKFNADTVAWWEHFGNVRGRWDNLDESLGVALNPNNPPIERLLDAALRKTSAPSGPTSETLTIQALVGTPPNLRHDIVNAVGPLRAAVDIAIATGSKPRNYNLLWDHFEKGSVAHQDYFPFALHNLFGELKQSLLPPMCEGKADKVSLLKLSTALAQMIAIAAAADRPQYAWPTIDDEFLGHLSKEKLRILWIDDEDAWYDAVAPLMVQLGIDARHSSSAEACLTDLDAISDFDAVVVDIILEGQGDSVRKLLADHDLRATDIDDSTAGIGILQLIQSLPQSPPVFMLSARASPTIVSACAKFGAQDFFAKDRDDHVRMLFELRRNAESHQKRLSAALRPANPHLVVENAGDPLAKIMLRLDQIATSGSTGPVLFVGEPGVGKEELAREIHLRSRFRNGPFVAIECSSIPRETFESEVFGHLPGAYTDGKHARSGLIRQGNGGVVFIDEIDKLDVGQQNRLLRFVEKREVRAMGADEADSIECLLVFGSNEDPKNAAKGMFSEPFVSRIDKYVFRIPPLHERADAVRAIAQALCTRISGELSCEPRHILARGHDWLREQAAAGRFDGQSGNIRGLRNLIEKTITYNQDRTDLGDREFADAAETGGLPSFADAGDGLRAAAVIAADGLLPAKNAAMNRIIDGFKGEFLREIIMRHGRAGAAAFLSWTDDNLRQHLKVLRAKGFFPWDI
jgi:DNA-binding NtrC family response regulator